MTEQNTRLGIGLMVLTMFIFALQDGISAHLAREYNVWMVVMIRYWFFVGFVIIYARAQLGSIRAVATTPQPFLQMFRGVLLAFEIIVTVYSFVLLGLIEVHAIFAAYPLMVVALSGPMLGEYAGWRRWAAVGVGFLGMLIILQPGVNVFSITAIIPVIAALMFSLYALLTRYVARQDTALTSFFWTGVGGAVAMTAIGPFFWEPMTAPDWGWMLLLCVLGASGHYLMIRAYEVAEASTIQPFAFFHLVFISVLGVFFFGEKLPWTTALGAGIVVAAGIYTALRTRQVENEA